MYVLATLVLVPGTTRLNQAGATSLGSLDRALAYAFRCRPLVSLVRADLSSAREIIMSSFGARCRSLGGDKLDRVELAEAGGNGDLVRC
jgi:hypothetical protein